MHLTADSWRSLRNHISEQYISVASWGTSWHGAWIHESVKSCADPISLGLIKSSLWLVPRVIDAVDRCAPGPAGPMLGNKEQDLALGLGGWTGTWTPAAKLRNGGGILGVGLNKVRKSSVACDLGQKGNLFLCFGTWGSFSEEVREGPVTQKCSWVTMSRM